MLLSKQLDRPNNQNNHIYVPIRMLVLLSDKARCRRICMVYYHLFRKQVVESGVKKEKAEHASFGTKTFAEGERFPFK